MTSVLEALPVPVRCPRCHGPLREAGDEIVCDSGGHRYPVVLGIPDLRVEPDVWLDLASDRRKAVELEERAQGEDFAATVRHYWALTPDTPRDLAEHYVRHALEAEERSTEWLQTLDAAPSERVGPWLDLGCGTADLAAAATWPVVGCDVALRWLVVARKRLQQAGRPPLLVCGNAERLPFPAGTFERVVALGLIEHVVEAGAVLAEARRVLRPGGDLRARTVNRYSLIPEPHVRVWAVGFVPRRRADGYVRWWSGRRYQHHRPLSPRELGRLARRSGFTAARVTAARALAHDRARLGPRLRWLAGPYNVLARLPVAGALLRWAAPALEMRAIAP